MKISKHEKEENFRKIVNSAVLVFTEKGFKETTLKDIAKAAKIAHPTIYKYFSTKESILYKYFELKMDDLIERLHEVSNFEEYRFQEQVHILLETNFEILNPDRKFLKIAYENVFLSNWLVAATSSEVIKKRFFDIMDDLINSAVERGEFPEPPFRKMLNELFWDYLVGITYYWTKDTSEHSVQTTQLIDKSLTLLNAMFRADVLGKGADIFKFLLREHLLSHLKNTPQKPRNFNFTQNRKSPENTLEKSL